MTSWCSPTRSLRAGGEQQKGTFDMLKGQVALNDGADDRYRNTIFASLSPGIKLMAEKIKATPGSRLQKVKNQRCS